MNILLSGSSGLVGQAVMKRLIQQGHCVSRLRRSEIATQAGRWNTQEIRGIEFGAVIHLAGENIAGQRWTRSFKERIRSSRVDGTKELIDFLRSLPSPPASFLCASAIGYYGSRGDESLDETSAHGDGFLAQLCQEWESSAQLLSSSQTRVVSMRFGMIMSGAGGALVKMAAPFKWGLGGRLGRGTQSVSWVAIEDVVKCVLFLLDHPGIEGAVNVVAPNPASNAEVTRAIGSCLKRFSFWSIPCFAVKILFGREMASELLLNSSRVFPNVLQKAGFCFEFDEASACVEQCLAEMKK